MSRTAPTPLGLLAACVVAAAAGIGVYAGYALALLVEWLNRTIFAATGLIFGHTLKHLVATAGCAWALAWLLMRRPSSLGGHQG